MDADLSLDQIRRKAYLAYHQDGIVDILIGGTVLGFGLWRITEGIVFTFLSWLSFSLYVGLKRAITIPRFGYVRFKETQRQTQISIGIGVGVLFLVAMIGFVFFTGPDQLPPALVVFMRKFHEFVMGGIGAIVMVVFGLLFGIKRVTGYGIFMLVALWFSLQLEIPASVALLLIGGVILIIGLVLLLSFVRRYRIKPLENENAP